MFQSEQVQQQVVPAIIFLTQCIFTPWLPETRDVHKSIFLSCAPPSYDTRKDKRHREFPALLVLAAREMMSETSQSPHLRLVDGSIFSHMAVMSCDKYDSVTPQLAIFPLNVVEENHVFNTLLSCNGCAAEQYMNSVTALLSLRPDSRSSFTFPSFSCNRKTSRSSSFFTLSRATFPSSSADLSQVTGPNLQSSWHSAKFLTLVWECRPRRCDRLNLRQRV